MENDTKKSFLVGYRTVADKQGCVGKLTAMAKSLFKKAPA